MIEYHVVLRTNVHASGGEEYALYATDKVSSISYTLWTWEREPTPEKMKEVISNLTHAMKFAYAIQPSPKVDLDRYIVREEVVDGR